MFSFQQISISKLPIGLNLFHLAFTPKVSLKFSIPASDLFFYHLRKGGLETRGCSTMPELKVIGK